MKKCWDYFVNHIIGIIFLLLIMYYLLGCSYYMYIDPSYQCLGVIPFVLIGYFVLFYFLEKLQKKDEKKVKWIILIGSFLIYLIWELLNKTVPVSDYEVLWNAAKNVADGSFGKMTFDTHNYFYWWNHQIGYTIFLGGIVKIIGHNLFIMKLIEIMMLSVSNLLLYNVTKKIFSKRTALFTTLLYSTFLFNVGGAGIINNQHAAIFFVLLGLYFLLKDDRYLNKILCSIFFAVAFIVRPNAIIFLLALIVYFIWLGIKNFNRETVKKNLIAILLFLVPFVIVIKSFDFILIKTKTIPDSSFSAHCPYFKFILGAQWQNMHGEGTLDDLIYYDFDYDKYNLEAKNYVVQKYKTRFTLDILPFWYEKMIRFSVYPDSQIDFAGYEEKKIVGSLLKYYGYAQYILCLFAILGSSILLYKNKKGKFDVLNLFIISFLGFFFAHILLEVQPRYRYDQYITIALMASPFLVWCYDIVCGKLQKKKKEITQLVKKFEP